MIAMASGRSISAPEPIPHARGNIPSAAASEVISTGRRAAMAGMHKRLHQPHPFRFQLLDKIEHEDSIFSDNPHADNRAQE